MLLMPDLIYTFSKYWKLIVIITAVSTFIAFLASELSPKLYLSVTTVLPANSVTADKGRIFDNNVENLYSDVGTADELDRIEGTAALDTVYIATAKQLNLEEHYHINPSSESLFNASQELKKNAEIKRSAYGELKIKVWDRDKEMAAALANTILQNIQSIHQQIQSERNRVILQKIQEDYLNKESNYRQLTDSVILNDLLHPEIVKQKQTSILEQMQQDQKLIAQYQLAINTNPEVLLTVERARPAIWPDKPKVMETTGLVFIISLLFSILLAIYLNSRKQVL
jgi:Uncharacterized protein involved in exopolysaccharide biosynthesis